MKGQIMERWEILDAMKKYGGSFVKKLAELYELADLENQVKLTATFENYFHQYDEIARQDLERQQKVRSL